MASVRMVGFLRRTGMALPAEFSHEGDCFLQLIVLKTSGVATPWFRDTLAGVLTLYFLALRLFTTASRRDTLRCNLSIELNGQHVLIT